MLIAQNKRSAALGCTPKMMASFFSFWFGALAPHQTRRKKRDWMWRPFTQGGGLCGLALGQVASPGLRQGEQALQAALGLASL